MPPASFDSAADTYDETFTDTAIGQAQREQVYRYLIPLLNHRLNFLEINCGTGHDALNLAHRVQSYLATDASEEMIKVCHQKQKGRPTPNLEFKCLPIQALESELQQKHVVFSNFGGLNCLDRQEFLNFAEACRHRLPSDANVFLVIMGRFCWWESFYFLLKFQPKKAFRRWNPKGTKVRVQHEDVATWYYSPKQVRDFFSKGFQVVHQAGIGLFVPPSYLEPFFRNKKKWLGLLRALDKIFTKFKWTAHFADHYYIHLKPKP